MATGSATWDGSTDTDHEEDTNWTPEQHPANGDTETLDGTEGAGLPDANLPSSGTINFAITGGHEELELSTLLDGASFGTIDINHDDASVYLPSPSGQVTLTAGIGFLGQSTSADIELAGGELCGEDAAACTGTITRTANSTLKIDNGSFTYAAGLVLDDPAGDIALVLGVGGNPPVEFIGNIDCGTGATVTLGGSATITGNLTLDGGTIDWDGNELTVDGDLTLASDSTCSNKGNTVLLGTHNIDWTTWGDRLGTVELDASATITRTGGTAFEGLTIPAGATMDGAGRGTYIGGGTGAKIDIQGTYSGGDLRLTPTYPVTNTGAIALAEGCTLEVITQSSSAWTQSGAVSTKDILVRGATNGDLGVLNLTGGAGANSLGAVILGTDASDQAGKIDFADQTHTLESIESKANGGSNPNQIDFGESDITISGGTATIDGTNATIVNVSAVIHGGTLSNVDASGTNELDATDGVIDGGGNVNVNFGGGAAGSMLLMGAGG